MSPSDNRENGGRASARHAQDAQRGSDDTDANASEHREGPGSEPQSLGILFIAAALGLALLLTIVGLLAAAAMSRMPPAALGSYASTSLSA
jgi:hypothetical protein